MGTITLNANQKILCIKEEVTLILTRSLRNALGIKTYQGFYNVELGAELTVASARVVKKVTVLPEITRKEKNIWDEWNYLSVK